MKRLTPYEFAASIKAKYPQYADIEDVELAQRIVQKYPEYNDRVDVLAEVSPLQPAKPEKQIFNLPQQPAKEEAPISYTDSELGKFEPTNIGLPKVGLTSKNTFNTEAPEYFTGQKRGQEKYAETTYEAIANDPKASTEQSISIQQKELDREIEELQKQMPATTASERVAMAGMEGFQTGGTTGMLSGEAAERYQNLQDAKLTLIEAEKIMKAPKKQETVGVQRWGAGVKDELSNVDLWTMGMSAITRNMSALAIAKKLEAGQTLRPDEEALLDSFATLQYANLLREDDLSGGYQGGRGTVEMAKFVAELAVAGGLGKLATKGAEKALIKAIAARVSNKLGAKALEVGTKVLTRTTAAGIGGLVGPSTFESTTSNLLGQAYGTFDQDGKLKYKGRQDAMTGFGAYVQGWADTSIEYATEISGGSIGVIGKIFKNVPGIEKMLTGLAKTKLGRIGRVLGSNPVLKQVGVNGYLGEYNEEFDGAVVRHLLGMEDFKESFWNWDAQATLFYTLAPMSGFSAGMNMVQNAQLSAKFKKSDKAFTDLLKRNGYSQEDIDALKVSLLDAAPEQVGEQLRYIVGTMDGGIVEVDGKKTFNEDMYGTVLGFAVDAARWNAFTSGYENKLDEYRQQAAEYVKQNVNPDMDAVVFAQVDGKPVQVMKGRIVYNEEGLLDREQSSTEVYYRNDNGEIIPATIEKVSKLLEVVPTEQAAQQAGDRAVEPIINTSENETRRPYEVGEKVAIDVEGMRVQGVITGIVEAQQAAQQVSVSDREMKAAKNELKRLEKIAENHLDFEDYFTEGDVFIEKRGEALNVWLEHYTSVYEIISKEKEIPNWENTGITNIQWYEQQIRATKAHLDLLNKLKDARRVISSQQQQIQPQQPSGIRYSFRDMTGQEIQIEPRQIIEEDNLQGVDNGVEVEYTLNGELKRGIVEDFYQYQQQGQAIIDGELVNLSDIIGVASSNMSEITPENEGAAPMGDSNMSESGTITPNVEAQQNGVNIPVQPTYPLDKDGNPDFDNFTPEQLFTYTRDTVGEQEAIDDVNISIRNIQAEINKKQKGFDKLDMKGRAKARAAIQKLEADKAAFEALLPVAEEVASVAPEAIQQPAAEVIPETVEQPQEQLPETESKKKKEKKEKEKGKSPVPPWFITKEAKLGEYKSLRDLIIRKLVLGQKLRWDDVTTEQGAILSRGLGGEYRYKQSEKTPRSNSWFGYVKDNGLTPEQFAHKIWEANAYEQGIFDDMPLYGYDTQDILNEILDVANTYSSAKEMILALEAEQTKLKKDENAYFDSLAEQERQIVENFDDDIFADVLGISNFTPEQLNELQQILNEYENTEEIEAGNVGNNNQAGPIEQDNEMPGAENPAGSIPVERRGISGSSEAVDRGSEGGIDQQIQSQQPELNPSEAQKEAGNYKKAHITVQGFDITIENPKGSVRSGIDADGNPWENVLRNHYGYFKGTKGKDGDQIDVFVGDNPESLSVFVVDQNNPETGEFDESKVMLGFNTAQEARAAYESNYNWDWEGFRAITPVSVEDFKKWLYDGARQRKPFAEYKDTPAPVEVASSPKADKQPWEMTREEFIPEKNILHAPTNKTDSPTVNAYKPGDRTIDIGDDPYIYEFRYVNPNDIDYNEKSESEESVLNRKDTKQYIEWFKQGIEPTPITVIYNTTKGKFVTTNRRRLLAAREAGVNKIPAFVEIGKHKDIIRQALSEGKSVPAEVLADYPELQNQSPIDNLNAILSGEKVVEVQEKVETVQSTPEAQPAEKPFDWNAIMDDMNSPLSESEQAEIKAQEELALEKEYQKMGFDLKWAATRKEAVKKLQENIAKNEAVIKDWSSREYKKSGGKSVEVGSNDDFEMRSVSVDSVNERRRASVIKNAQDEINDDIKDLKRLGIDYKPTEPAEKSEAVLKLEERKAKLKDKRKQIIVEMSQRNGLFGDVNADPNNPLDDGRIDANYVAKKLDDIDAQIKGIDQKIDAQIKRENSTAQQGEQAAKAQQAISFDEEAAPEAPKDVKAEQTPVADLKTRLLSELNLPKHVFSFYDSLKKSESDGYTFAVYGKGFTPFNGGKINDFFMFVDRAFNDNEEAAKEILSENYNFDISQIEWADAKRIKFKNGVFISRTNGEFKSNANHFYAGTQVNVRDAKEYQRLKIDEESSPKPTTIPQTKSEKLSETKSEQPVKQEDSKIESEESLQKDKPFAITPEQEQIVDDLLGGELSKALEQQEVEKKIELLDELTNGEVSHEDFGEKIGGAKKDMGITRTIRDTDSLPAWRRKYSYKTHGNVEMLGEKVDTSKPFMVQWAKEGKGWRGEKTTFYTPVDVLENGLRKYQTKVFTSEQEAEDYIPIYEAHRQGFRVRKGKDGYTIAKSASTGKVLEFDTFKTEQEAKDYLYSTEGATSLLNRKREDFSIPALEKVERTGKDWRKGKNVTTEEFMEQFGFRGGEFGNWVKPEERKVLLNTAYDSLMDLAEVLNISPKAISLNGNLSIAFGARGSKGAAAHYEPDRAVINLTRLNGAGSLAHEWAHALDNYFGLQEDKKDYSRDEKGELKTKRAFKTEGKSYKKGMRDELAKIFEAIVDQTSDKKVTQTMGVDVKQAEFDKFLSATQREANDLINKFDKGASRTKYNRKTKQYEKTKIEATPEQKEEAKTIIDKLLTGNSEVKWGSITGNPLGDHAYTNEDIKRLDEIHKAVFGHTGLKRNGIGFYNLTYYANKLNLAKVTLDKAKEGSQETLSIKTDFFNESKKFDAMRAEPYWTKKVEMFARAFEYYVQTKLESNNQKSDYLQYDKAPLYDAAFDMNPYPQGEERDALNKLFDEFFNTVEEDEAGALFQIIGEQGAASLDAAEEATIRIDNLLIAKSMEAENETPLSIRLATGWERGADGKWRYEIQDVELSDSIENDYKNDRTPSTGAYLRFAVKGKELFEAYPKLLKTKIELRELAGYEPNGWYDAKTNTITANSLLNKDALKSVLIHEIQHAIQYIEGFAVGGNSSKFKDINTKLELKSEIINFASKLFDTLPEEVKPFARAINREENVEENYEKLSKNKEAKIIWADYVNARRQIEDIENSSDKEYPIKTAYQQYKNLAGEVEARNAQTRMNMTAEQRRQTLLSETADVAPEDQIFLFNSIQSNQEYNPLFQLISPTGFYSTVETALEAIQQTKGTPEQFKAMLLKNGAKQAEMDWMDYDGTFTGNSVTKAEIQQWIDENRIEVEEVEKSVIVENDTEITDEMTDSAMDELKKAEEALERYLALEQDYELEDNSIYDDTGYSSMDEAYNARDEIRNNPDNYIYEDVTKREDSTKFSQYVLPGGENYKELLLTMPDYTTEWRIQTNIQFKALSKRIKKRLGIEEGTSESNVFNPYDYEDMGVLTVEEKKELNDIKNAKAPKSFKSSHFDEPNILAHVRFNERIIQPKRAEQFNKDFDDWKKGGKVGVMPNHWDYGKDERVLFIEEIQSDFSQSIKKKEDEFKKLLKENPEKVLDMFKKSGKLEVLCP